jgi:hypothetical protein
MPSSAGQFLDRQQQSQQSQPSILEEPRLLIRSAVNKFHPGQDVEMVRAIAANIEATRASRARQREAMKETLRGELKHKTSQNE